MKQRFESSNPALDDQSVYRLEVDHSIYDVNLPTFVQTHCLRFEIDRSKVKDSLSVKITDVDFSLNGNRHLKADTTFTL